MSNFCRISDDQYRAYDSMSFWCSSFSIEIVGTLQSILSRVPSLRLMQSKRKVPESTVGLFRSIDVNHDTIFSDSPFSHSSKPSRTTKVNLGLCREIPTSSFSTPADSMLVSLIDEHLSYT